MEKLSNPFVSSGYFGPDYFCDRETETLLLSGFINNGVHVALFSIRRLGKTGLIKHVFNSFEYSTKVNCIYLDILATQNLGDFTNQLATAIYNRFPARKSMGKKIIEMVQRFRPTITFDELNGAPSITLTLDTKAQKENTLGQLLSFLDAQKTRVVFAIDEFQQILSYPENNVEAILRTQMQQLKNTSFIFCGSNQKMMHEFFNSAKRPFFASCTSVSLENIPKEAYQKFIEAKFRQYNKNIDKDCLTFICEWTCLHTFYTQYFCFSLFNKQRKNNTLQDAYETANEILQLSDSNFYQYKNLLTQAQWNLLRAIAKEGRISKTQSKTFIQKYNLGTPSLVKRGMDALLTKEMIFQQTGVAQPYFEVYDKFLMRWLQKS